MAAADFDPITVGEFLDLSLELENTATEKYQQFFQLSENTEIKQTLSNFARMCCIHTKLLKEIKNKTSEEHSKIMTIMLPSPSYLELFEDEETMPSFKVLHEAAKAHLELEENMLINYGRLNQVLVNEDIVDMVGKLIDDQSHQLKIMTEIVKRCEKTHKI